MNTRKILLGALMLPFLMPAVVSAATLTDGSAGVDECIRLNTPLLKYRSSDASTGGEVSLIQDFLITKGLLSGTPTGFFGKLTVEAVKKYQGQQGFEKTGAIGALTGRKITDETCTNAATTPVVSSGSTNSTTVSQNSGVDVEAIKRLIQQLMAELALKKSMSAPAALTFDSISGGCDTAGVSPRYKVTLRGRGFNGLQNIMIDRMTYGQEKIKDIWSQTDSSADFYLPWYSGNYYTMNTWIIDGSGKTTNRIPLYVDMRGSCGSTEVKSDAPSAAIIGTPSLGLEYDQKVGSSVLAARYELKITAGDKAISRSNFMGGSPVHIIFNGNSQFPTQTVYALDGITSDIAPRQTVSVSIRAYMVADKMFAGSYYATLGSDLYTRSVSGNVSPERMNIGGTMSTQSVVVVGERSPYILGTVNDATPNVNVTIRGNRFSPTSNVLIINGRSKTIASYDSQKDVATINFQMTDFGLTAAGTYNIQVTTPEGASNVFPAYFSNAPTSQTADPAITMLSSPTLALQYDSANKESVLSAHFSFRLAAGSQAIRGNLWGGASPVQIRFNGPGGVQNVTYKLLTGSSVISANTTADYEMIVSVNPNQLFAGSYTAELIPSVYLPDSGSYARANVGGVSLSPAVTIVGERAPFLSGAMMDGCVGCNLAVIISGVRFDPTSNFVQIGGTSATFPSTNNGTKITVPAAGFDFNLSGIYPVTVSTSEGTSNRVNTYTKG